MSIVVNKTRLPVTQWQTESGSVVSISDARKRYAKSLSVALEPIQDLHGYANPWVGGAGVNKLYFVQTVASRTEENLYYANIDIRDRLNQYVINSFTLQAGVTYTLTMNVQSSVEPFNISVGAGINTYAKDVASIGGLSSGINSITFTPTEGQLSSGAVLAIRPVRYSTPKSFTWSVSEIQLEVGSSFTGFKPYENLCPISGWDAVKVTRAGKNLYEPTVTEYKNESGASFNGYDITSLVTFLNTLPTGTYNVSFKFNVLETVSGATSWGILLRNSVSGYIDGRKNGQHNSGETLSFTRSITITAENKGQFVNAYLYSGGGNKAKVYWYDFQLELGSTATAYEPYNSNTYTIQLGQTVYGGSLNVTTGVLTVTHGCYTITGSEAWNTNAGNPNRYYTIAYLLRGIAKLPVDNYSSVPIQTSIGNFDDSYNSMQYKNGKMCIAADGRIGINANLYDLYGGTEVLKDVQICYELATPQTIQLTAHQIEMLMRNNTVWSDAGLVTLEYARIRQ